MDSPGRAHRKLEWVSPQDPDSRKIKPTISGKTPAIQLNIAQVPRAKQGPLPEFVPPALALLNEGPPEGKNWIHEIKFGGYRLQARIDDVAVGLLSRRGLDWTARFPSVVRALQPLRVASALLDGELIVEDEHGVSNFAGLLADLKGKRHSRLVFVAFDLLYCNGFNLMGASQLERKAVLRAIIQSLPPNSVVRYSEHLDLAGSGNLLQKACKMGLEGIVSKRADAPYISGRAEHWIKAKCHRRQEFVIVGYVHSTANPLAIGSLVVGYYEKGVLVHAGRVGTGFSNALAIYLKKKLDAIPAPQPKFKSDLSSAICRSVVWAEPKLVAEIEYGGWSSDNLLRHSSFKGLREDKPAKEITLEQAKS